MSNFSWQSDEERAWDSPPEPGLPAPGARRPWQRWLLLLLIAGAGLAAVTTVVYRRLNQRADEVSFAQEASIRDSQALIYAAARQGDGDLFLTMLSGRDGDWAASQRRLVDAGLLYRRPGFGLQWLPTEPETAITAVEIAPDFAAAVVTTTHRYAVAVGHGLTETVSLAQPAIYRRGSDRWLISPPDDAFWGATETSRGQLLRLTYPARDAALGRRLAADIEADLNALCHRFPDLACQEGPAVTVRLSVDPASLLAANRPEFEETAERRFPAWYSIAGSDADAGALTLPTPTLVGRPVDAAGYRALVRGYSTRILSYQVVRLVGWACCEGFHLFQALLDAELAQLGLKPWPVTATDRGRLLGASLSSLDLARRSTGLSPESSALATYVAVEFLVAETGASPVAMQRLMAAAPAGNWLAQAAGPRLASPGALDRAWWRYLYLQSPAAGAPPETPLPRQSLAAVCRSADAGDAWLYEVAPATRSWTLLRALGREEASLVAVPQTDALLVGEQGPGSAPFASTFLYEAGRQALIARERSQGAARTVSDPVAVSPDGRYAVFFEPRRNAVPYAILDLAACRQQGACQGQALLGRPLWSPQARRTMLLGNGASDDVQLIFAADARAENVTVLAEGSQATWLDDDTAAYVVDGRELVTVHVPTGTRQTVAQPGTLAAVLAPDQRLLADQMRIRYIMASPVRPGTVWVAWADAQALVAAGYLLAVDLASGEVSTAMTWPTVAGQEPIFIPSPDRTALAAFTPRDADGGLLLQWHHLASGVTRHFPLGGVLLPPTRQQQQQLSWSADGQWLALVQDGFVHLVAPEGGEERWLMPAEQSCSAAIWWRP